MNIIHAVPEVLPFSFYSSLAEAAANLPAGEARYGHNVTVFSPLYSQIDINAHKIKNTGLKTWVDAGYTVYEYELYTAEYNGVKYVFFRNDDLFGRNGIYGTGVFDYADNDIRYGTFCQAAMNYIRYHNIPCDILHSHSWQTALISVYKNLYHNNLKCKTVLTIYAFDNLGVFNKFSVETLNLPWDIYNIDYLEYYDNLSFLKGGLTASDICTAISPTFASELVSPESSVFNEVFVANAHKIKGILNGIDFGKWNPATDGYITAKYNCEDISGKKVCKDAFCAKYDIDANKPLVCFITKLISARGVELILKAVKKFHETGANFVIMGHSGTEYNSSLEEAKNTPCVKVLLGDYSKSSHEAYSASDIVLLPSLYEPCGIGQFIGMRYGAVPVVRDTGGLHDGIKSALELGAGFIFKEFTVQAMIKAIKNAVELVLSEKRDDAVKNLMKIDNSWTTAAGKYIDLYNEVLAEE